MKFGAYEVREKFGAGGMGEIWLGVHSALGRTAAIKVVRPEAIEGGDTEKLLRRFEREARATSCLRSPHTIEVYDFGITDEGVFYYAMEFLEGCNLDTLVQRSGPIHASRAASILRQVCDSLEEAHRSGMVHRDIKPANIHLCKMGLNYDFVKVLDFGLVKSQAAPETDAKLTDANVVQGTPAFMPPETLHGAAALESPADIYSLGCVAYWLVTGQLVFEADSPMAAVIMHVKDEPVPPSQRVELPIPAAFEDIVMRCLAKEPAERPTSAELSRLLEACDFDPPWTRDQAEAWWLTHNPQSWAAPDVVGTPSQEMGQITPLRRPEAERIAVAVLPFHNTSGDPEQEYFSDGVAEDVIRELGRFKPLAVTSRSSSFAFKGKGLSAVEIARELGARYIVEGSVRRMGDRLRLSVELSDARKGVQLWAERYDRQVADLFDVQEDVVQRIVATVAGRLRAERAAHARRKPTSSLDAWDCLLRGLEHHNRHTKADEEEACKWFARAAELDPDFASAYALQVCALAGTGRWQVNPDGTPLMQGQMYEDARKLLDRAFELDSSEPEVNRILAVMSMQTGELERAQSHLDRGLARNPNHDALLSVQGELYMCLGQPHEAVAWTRRAMEINPFHPPRLWGQLGRALYLAERYDEALAALKRVPGTRRMNERAYTVACKQRLGMTDDVERDVASIMADVPSFSTAVLVARQRLSANLAERLAADLEAAGLPA